MARALKAEGFTVILDRKVTPGDTWRNAIGKALDAATVIVVLWSVHSVRSEWVIAEADIGRNQEKLVPVLIDHVKPPFGFRMIQAADLSEWDGSPTNPNFGLLLDALNHLTNKLPPAFVVTADLPGETVRLDPTLHYKHLYHKHQR